MLGCSSLFGHHKTKSVKFIAQTGIVVVIKSNYTFVIILAFDFSHVSYWLENMNVGVSGSGC
jgi:hypothetical protein